MKKILCILFFFCAISQITFSAKKQKRGKAAADDPVSSGKVFFYEKDTALDGTKGVAITGVKMGFAIKGGEGYFKYAPLYKDCLVVPSQIKGLPVVKIKSLGQYVQDSDYNIRPPQCYSASDFSFTKVVLPDSVEVIDDYAFAYCTCLKSITLPKNLKKIGKGAFLPVTQEYIVPDDLTALDIDKESFVVMGEEWYTAYKTLSSKIESNRARKRDKEVGSGAATVVTLDKEGDFLYELDEEGTGVMVYGLVKPLDSDKWYKVVIPQAIKGFPVTRIISKNPYGEDKSAFARQNNIKQVVLCNSIKTIQERVFFECVNLSDITFPHGLIAIGDSAFEGCKALNITNFPNDLTLIGSDAFKGCRAIKVLDFKGTQLCQINPHAFEDCTALEAITIPLVTESIGSGAFKGCKMLKAVNIPDEMTVLDTDDDDYDNTFEGCDLDLAVRAKLRQLKNASREKRRKEYEENERLQRALKDVRMWSVK